MQHGVPGICCDGTALRCNQEYTSSCLPAPSRTLWAWGASVISQIRVEVSLISNNFGPAGRLQRKSMVHISEKCKPQFCRDSWIRINDYLTFSFRICRFLAFCLWRSGVHPLQPISRYYRKTIFRLVRSFYGEYLPLRRVTTPPPKCWNHFIRWVQDDSGPN